MGTRHEPERGEQHATAPTTFSSKLERRGDDDDAEQRERPRRLEADLRPEDTRTHCGLSAAISYSSAVAARRTTSSAARTAFCACAGYGIAWRKRTSSPSRRIS